jgi:hypothetical protein
VYISSAVHTYACPTAIRFALGVHTRPDTGYHWRMFLRGGCGCVCSSADVRVDGHLGWSESLICICMSYRSVLRPWLVSEQYYREQPRIRESRTSGDTHISIIHRGPHASRVSWSQFSLNKLSLFNHNHIVCRVCSFFLYHEPSLLWLFCCYCIMVGNTHGRTQRLVSHGKKVIL